MTRSDYYTKLESIILSNNGLLRSKDATDAGVPRLYVIEYAKLHSLENVQKGIYLSNDAIADGMYLLQCAHPNLIFSHETALFLHELTDREPLQYTATVKSGYNPVRLNEKGVKVYKVKPELFELGLVTIETPFGRTVRTYNRERTICDIIRSRSRIDFQSVQTSLKLYTSGKNKNLPLLMRYAKEFKVDNILQKYLEVLL
ncbi:MAG: type IV toxin-antitoxin system AbiEi family antitoxin domain-containing protein [Candidatus Howiella sp.]|jgi:predicted transcriptional regulator of viral defense system